GSRWTSLTSAKKANKMVYFIQAEKSKLVKIGKTARDVNLRLREMQTGSADRLRLLTSLPAKNEKAFHERFSRDRVHGEWFRPSSALLIFIRNIDFMHSLNDVARRNGGEPIFEWDNL